MDAASTCSPAERVAGESVRTTPLRHAGRRLLGYARSERASVALGMVALFGAAALEPLLPALFHFLLDHGFQPKLPFRLWWVPVGVVGLFFLRGALSFCGSYLFARSTARAVLVLRTDLIQAVMRSEADLYTRLSPGVAASRIINDPQNATQALAGAGTLLLREGTTLIALLIYLLYLNWSLTLLVLIVAPAIALVVRSVQRRIIAVSGASYESQVRLVGIVDDITRAWRVVRTFDATEFEAGRFDREARVLSRTTLKAATAGAMMTPLTQVIASIGIAVIITFALGEAARGGATVGEFVAFLTAMLMTISPLKRLTDVSQPVVGGLVQARACFDLMDTPPEQDRGDIELDRCEGEIRFERATVRYPGAERAALRDIDLVMRPGRVTALVGASGAGKSTVIGTLLGFAEPEQGCVRLDGIDLRRIRKASLRRQFAVVSQDIVLLDASIDDNVVYAKAHDPARIEQCLRSADLWDFVQQLPDRGNTVIGANGSRLSGGQRQRVAIARALYKDASVWIFDEASSALDSASEHAIQQSIERWRGERCVVLISHRLSTIRHADDIQVMAEGCIVESGDHATLMRQGGMYSAMVNAQAL